MYSTAVISLDQTRLCSPLRAAAPKLSQKSHSFTERAPPWCCLQDRGLPNQRDAGKPWLPCGELDIEAVILRGHVGRTNESSKQVSENAADRALCPAILLASLHAWLLAIMLQASGRTKFRSWLYSMSTTDFHLDQRPPCLLSIANSFDLGCGHECHGQITWEQYVDSPNTRPLTCVFIIRLQ